MSDIEDDMDIDEPVVKSSVMFSSEDMAAKGKRSAANLPVEAEDSLPWYDGGLYLLAYIARMVYFLGLELMVDIQGREIPTKYPRRRFRSPGHISYH